MNFHTKIKNAVHSLMAKIMMLIVLIAVTVLLTVYVFAQVIFASSQSHLHFLLIVILVIIFTTAGFLFHRMISPIRKLSEGVKEISKGNLDVKLNYKGADEIGKMARAFNQMTNDLKLMIEARDQLLLDVSHELRTPLTRAKIALEMTDESEFIITVKRNISEVETMITELLESQRLRNSLDKLEVSNINLENFIGKIGEEYESDSLKINLISPGLSVHADENLLKITLRNVIDNALKYSPEESPSPEISVIDTSQQLIIQVEDSGNGLSEGEIEKVFEPFYRTDKSRSRKTGGYGLGLHLCKRIMNAHKGSITLKNREESPGLVARLVFPK